MPVATYDIDTLRAVYGAADRLDFAPFADLLADEVVMHLPGVGIEVAGVQECTRTLQMMYADLQVRQRPVSVSRHGPFVVVLVDGSSALRARLEAVHVLRVDAADRVVEFWGITSPMPSTGG